MGCFNKFLYSFGNFERYTVKLDKNTKVCTVIDHDLLIIFLYDSQNQSAGQGQQLWCFYPNMQLYIRNRLKFPGLVDL